MKALTFLIIVILLSACITIFADNKVSDILGMTIEEFKQLKYDKQFEKYKSLKWEDQIEIYLKYYEDYFMLRYGITAKSQWAGEIASHGIVVIDVVLEKINKRTFDKTMNLYSAERTIFYLLTGILAKFLYSKELTEAKRLEIIEIVEKKTIEYLCIYKRIDIVAKTAGYIISCFENIKNNFILGDELEIMLYDKYTALGIEGIINPGSSDNATEK